MKTRPKEADRHKNNPTKEPQAAASQATAPWAERHLWKLLNHYETIKTKKKEEHKSKEKYKESTKNITPCVNTRSGAALTNTTYGNRTQHMNAPTKTLRKSTHHHNQLMKMDNITMDTAHAGCAQTNWERTSITNKW